MVADGLNLHLFIVLTEFADLNITQIAEFSLLFQGSSVSNLTTE